MIFGGYSRWIYTIILHIFGYIKEYDGRMYRRAYPDVEIQTIIRDNYMDFLL